MWLNRARSHGGSGRFDQPGGSSMNGTACVVTTVAELVEAVQAAQNASIEVRGTLEGAPSLRLKPGQKLRGAAGASIRFEPGRDGVVLTTDNVVEEIELQTDPERRAIYNDTSAEGFGRLVLRRLRTAGCVRLIADDAAAGGHVEALDVHVLEADARAFEERPAGFGVEVVPGAFTLWNRQALQDRRVSAVLRGIAAGRAGTPVRGSGILVGGTLGGGGMIVSLLETGEIHSDGGIAPGTPDRISGGVFVLQGTGVDEIHNLGPVTTYGPNDMVLDNWGRVERWHAHGKVTSYGPIGIGFVNLGELGTLVFDDLLETHGLGACGFNSGEVKQATEHASTEANNPSAQGSVEAGTIRQATFERIVTRGDGAIGIQISVPAGRILVRNGIETFGGMGASLARGVVTNLAAIALSVKPGGSAREMVIEGGLTTHGKGIEAIELHGQIDALRISGAAGPAGGGFTAV